MAEYRLAPLEVFALNERFVRATGTIPYKSLIWTRRFTKSGEFSMVVPASIYDPGWAYIYTSERPETGIIQKVEFSDTAQTYEGDDTVTVSGFFLESILNRVTFLVEEPATKEIKHEIKQPVDTWRRVASTPYVYQDAAGNYYYESKTGDYVDAKTGKPAQGDDSWKRVDYAGHYNLPMGGNATYNVIETGAYTSDGGKTITTTSDVGGVHDTGKYDVLFKTDRGDYFYINDSGKLNITTGVTTQKEGGYWAQLETWNHASWGDFDDDGKPDEKYTVETVQVQGPWQRTEMLDPTTVGDSLKMCWKWLQRFMGTSFIYVIPEFPGIEKAVDPSKQLLGDLAYKLCNEVGAAPEVQYDFLNDTMTVRAWRGVDRTQDQDTWPWAVFSDTWGTLTGYEASRDESNYRNTCFVLYEYDLPRAFDEKGHPVVRKHYKNGENATVDNPDLVFDGWQVASDPQRGYVTARIDDGLDYAAETMLDDRDSKPSCDSLWEHGLYDTSKYPESKPPTFDTDMRAIYDAYPKALEDKGRQHLEENYPIVTSLDTGVIDTAGYLKDWSLGDLVDMRVETVGLEKQARIIEVEESYDEDGGEVRITMGDEVLTAIKKARLM